MTTRLTGLIAATHTPFDANGDLNLAAVEKQAELLIRTGVSGVFIAGTTGESQSLSLGERLALSQRWSEVVRSTSLRLIVHVGSNCLPDARELASQAEKLGVAGIAAVAPSYFKAKTVETLVACCEQIASAAPGTPFYYYDIPSMTGLTVPMPEFLDLSSKKIPTMAGLKFSNPDLLTFQLLVNRQEGRFDIPWGTDEFFLGALALGATCAVGSSYNFAAPISNRLLAAFAAGDWKQARVEQFRSAQLIDLLIRNGFMASGKAVMGMLGVDVGPARLPNGSLTPTQAASLRKDLEVLGFFDWLKACENSKTAFISR